MIDVIIPVFRDDRIARAVRSVTSHRQGELVRLIIMDGSRDAAFSEHLNDLLRPTDLHVKESDRGIFDALNKGLDRVRAPWLGWMGSDDYFASDLDFQAILDQPDSIDGVAFSTVMFEDGSMRPRRLYVPVVKPVLRRMGWHLPHFSTFLRGRVVTDLRFDFERYGNLADIPFFVELEQRRPNIAVSKQVSTYMALGGVSNGSRRLVIRNNVRLIRIVNAIANKPIGAIFVLNKLLYKLAQLHLARRIKTNG